MLNMKLFSKKQNKNGFGIVEVIVAVGIITVGIIPIITLFTQNLQNEIKNKNVLIAAYLANESIEIVRQERDDNWTAGVTDWMGVGGANPIPTDGSEVIVNLVADGNIKEGWTVKAPANDDRKKVYLNSNDIYVQSNNSIPGWKETGFERYLTIKTGTAGCFLLGADKCVEITSYVEFNGTQIVEVRAYLYNGWK